MKDKRAGREIFWTYHFFEYIDDYIESNSQVGLTASEHQDEEPSENFELLTTLRKQQKRVSSRKDKIRLLDQEEEIKWKDISSQSSRVY